MPNIKSAKKRMKTSELARQRNRADNSRVLTARRRFMDLVEKGEKDQAQAAFNAFCSMLDKAAKRGVIKQGNADRRKARAAARLAKMEAAAA
jgi:small subunit ribosomal protein S20